MSAARNLNELPHPGEHLRAVKKVNTPHSSGPGNSGAREILSIAEPVTAILAVALPIKDNLVPIIAEVSTAVQSNDLVQVTLQTIKENPVEAGIIAFGLGLLTHTVYRVAHAFNRR